MKDDPHCQGVRERAAACAAAMGPCGLTVTAAGTAGLGVGALLFIFKAPILAFFSRLRPDRVLQHPRRALLLELVEANPGISYQELRIAAGLGKGTLEHHLAILLSHKHVKRIRSSGRTCYVPSVVQESVALALSALRSPPARQFARTLAAPAATRDLCRILGLSISAVHFHRRRLVAAGVIENIGTPARPSWKLTQLGTAALER